eukprot:2089022-Pleurochrysis_carterae.AAC.2
MPGTHLMPTYSSLQRIYNTERSYSTFVSKLTQSPSLVPVWRLQPDFHSPISGKIVKNIAL